MVLVESWVSPNAMSVKDRPLSPTVKTAREGQASIFINPLLGFKELPHTLPQISHIVYAEFKISYFCTLILLSPDSIKSQRQYG